MFTVKDQTRGNPLKTKKEFRTVVVKVVALRLVLELFYYGNNLSIHPY